MNTPPIRCKEIYERHEYDGVKLRDMAKELGVSEQRVSQLYRRWKRYIENEAEKSKWSIDNIIQLDLTGGIMIRVAETVSTSVLYLSKLPVESIMRAREVGLYHATLIKDKATKHIENNKDYYNNNVIEINNATYNVTKFIEWWKQFKNEDNRYGDLIRDIESDSDFPRYFYLRLYTFDDLRNYFICHHNACQCCIDTLESAYDIFCSGKYPLNKN